jgi:hypothetical protein
MSQILYVSKRKININYKFSQTFSFLIVLALSNKAYLYLCQETFLLIFLAPDVGKEIQFSISS